MAQAGLRKNFSALPSINPINAEANEYIQELCSSGWLKSGKRGVVFLDPFGMQVEWSTIESIAEYLINRLNNTFAGVAPNPLILYKKCNNSLYLFCFARGNPHPKAKELALKIATHILKKMR